MEREQLNQANVDFASSLNEGSRGGVQFAVMLAIEDLDADEIFLCNR